MGFELSGGKLFIDYGNGPELLGSNLSGTAEVEISAKDELSTVYNMTNTAELSCEMTSFDLDFIKKLCDDFVPKKDLKLEYQVPIMVQARWHKKPRIRKKWLKRFGMKQDVVKVVVDAHAVELYPVYSLDEQENHYIQIVPYNFEFETNKHEYIFKPYQIAKGLKIEW